MTVCLRSAFEEPKAHLNNHTTPNSAVYSGKHAAVGRAMYDLAAALRADNRPSEAADVLVKVVDTYQHALPAHDPEIPTAMNNLAVMLRSTGRHDEAGAANSERPVRLGEDGCAQSGRQVGRINRAYDQT